MARNRPKWTETDQSEIGPNLTEMDRSRPKGPKWTELDRLDRDGPKRPK